MYICIVFYGLINYFQNTTKRSGPKSSTRLIYKWFRAGLLWLLQKKESFFILLVLTLEQAPIFYFWLCSASHLDKNILNPKFQANQRNHLWVPLLRCIENPHKLAICPVWYLFLVNINCTKIVQWKKEHLKFPYLGIYFYVSTTRS